MVENTGIAGACRTLATGLGRQSQACLATATTGQSTVRAAAKVPARNHRDSRHGLPIYPNLAAGMVLTSIDQLWVADITYIHLQWEFVYLAVVLDVVLGWFVEGVRLAILMAVNALVLPRCVTGTGNATVRP
jgi:hypothetical protein